MEGESTFEKQSKVPLRTDSLDAAAYYERNNRDTLATSTDLADIKPYEPPMQPAGRASDTGSMMSIPRSTMLGATSEEESGTSVHVDGS